ncbi:MAG: ABC transporter substrate-binding protein [Xanthobacteraceae bacterium]
MRRRAFITMLGGAAAWPLAARAQQPAMPVVGFLRDSSPDASTAILTALRQGMKEAGFIEGQNVAIEYRWSEGQFDQLPKLAAELVRRQVAIIVAAGNDAGIAAKAATTTIPIVFAIGDDPVEMGIVALNRPEGNVTGVTFYSGALTAKAVELLHELVPTATTIGLLLNANSPTAETQMRETRAATRVLGQQLYIVNARNERDIDAGFAVLEQKGVGALLIPGDAEFTGQRDRLVALAARYRMPTMYPQDQFVAAGGLMSYGASIIDAYRHVGDYTGRILKGAKVSDLPVMLPTKYQFVINLKTAKALGLTVPQSLLATADEVIE